MSSTKPATRELRDACRVSLAKQIRGPEDWRTLAAAVPHYEALVNQLERALTAAQLRLEHRRQMAQAAAAREEGR